MDGMHDLGGKQGFGKIRYSKKARTYHAPWEKRVNAMTGLARALAKLGREDDAKTWLNTAVQSNPQNSRAWYQLGLLAAASDPAAARSSYENHPTQAHPDR